MTEILQGCAIMHIAIGVVIQWLNSKIHELGGYKLGMFLMGVVVDILYDFCIEIQKNTRKIIDADFIMNIFDEIRKDIP